jgi:hypothetical protein
MQLPNLSPPTEAAVALWPRVLERAGGGAVTDELAHRTKARIAHQLATAIDTAEMRKLFDELERDDPDQYWSSGKARAEAFGVRDRSVVGMLALASGWETSGAMEGALGLAFHLSAVASFGLASETLERVRAEADGHTLARGNELHARHEDALRSYLERQYEETQRFLTDDDVIAYRGTTGRPEHAGLVSQTLRPLSSFALERSVAIAFPNYGNMPADCHYALIAATVPAARILSTPVTGMASLLECEVVVLGAQRAGDAVEQFVAPAGERVPG